MDKQVFDSQMSRLKQKPNWKQTYWPERENHMWESFKTYPNSYMVKVVDQFVMNAKAAPVFKDFNREFSKLGDVHKDGDKNQGPGLRIKTQILCDTAGCLRHFEMEGYLYEIMDEKSRYCKKCCERLEVPFVGIEPKKPQPMQKHRVKRGYQAILDQVTKPL